MVYVSKNNTSYFDIPANAVDDDDEGNLEVEGPITVSPRGRMRKSLGQTSENIGRCDTPIGIFSLGFVVGALMMLSAQSLYSYRSHHSRTRQNVHKSNLNQMPVEFSDAERNEKDAVSYDFLRTAKGSSTIRTLLKDLIHPSPEAVATPSTKAEEADYERLGGPRRALTHLTQLMRDDGTYAYHRVVFFTFPRPWSRNF